MKISENDTKQAIVRLFDPWFVILFWVSLFALPLFFHWINNSSIHWDFILNVWADYIPLLVIFCINRLFLIKKILYKSRPLLYIFAVSALIAVTVIVTQKVTLNKRMPAQEQGMLRFSNPPRPRPAARFDHRRPSKGAYPSYINLILLSVLMVGFDTGTKLSVKWARAEGQKAELEKESIKNELAFLRNQISPHFLMNTLNNIHSLVDIDSDEAKSAIGKLSVLMRHLLYESDERPTAISKEINFIESYINLMQLRFPDEVDIKLDLPEDLPEISIPPLLFTNILENAFKYGISYKHKSFVHIKIEIRRKRLEFSIENSSFRNNNLTESSGIGIENTEKRLKLLYNKDYSFSYSETEGIFKASINIPV